MMNWTCPLVIFCDNVLSPILSVILPVASPTVFRDMVETIIANPEWPTNHRALLCYKTYDWREPLDEVIKAFSGGNARNMQIAVWKMSENWNQSTSAVIAELGEWGVPVDDFFSLERSISYNLSTTLALINAIRLELVEDAVDLSPFVSRLSYAFLPRLVYQLEEYGLPRMISKQLSRAEMFDFENEDRVESPERLNEYIRVANPGTWVMVSALLLVLAAFIAWGLIGTIPRSVTLKGVVDKSTGYSLDVVVDGEFVLKYKELADLYKQVLDLLKRERIIDGTSDTVKYVSKANEDMGTPFATYYKTQVKEKYGDEVIYNDSVFFLPVINKVFEMTKI